MQTALERQLQLLSEATRETLFLPRLDELDETLIDLLANEYHVDNYDLRRLTLSIKRALIREAILDHRIKGTPAAVEKIMRYIFRTAYVEEWFEYDGEPYRFRIWQDVTSDDESADFDTMERVRLAVTETKNTRSWLDFYGFTIAFQETQPVSDSNRMLIRQVYDDWYEYRRQNAAYNGEVDFGKYRYYDGELNCGGDWDYGGFESHGNYGQYQASDFEELQFWLTMQLPAEEVAPRDSNRMTIRVRRMHEQCPSTDLYTIAIVRDMQERIAPPKEERAILVTSEWAEECAPTLESDIEVDLAINDHQTIGETFSTLEFIYSANETIEPIELNAMQATLPIVEEVEYYEENVAAVIYDRSETIAASDEMSEPVVLVSEYEEVGESASLGAMAATVSTSEESLAPGEGGDFVMYQEVGYGGLDCYDGAISHIGTLTAAGHFLTAAEREAWARTRDDAILQHITPCEQCGSFNYEYKMGSVRTGSERFLVTDIQQLSVRIQCADCGAIAAEYPVPEEEEFS